MTQYKNPIPVVVGIVTMEGGVLTVKRSIEPCIGLWALPGGYLEEGESWQDRLAKEIEEEACIVVSTDRKDMTLYDAHTTPDGKKLLIFAHVTNVIEKRPFVPNSEASDREIHPLNYYSCPNLCFSLHQQVIDRFREQYHCPETARSPHAAGPGAW